MGVPFLLFSAHALLYAAHLSVYRIEFRGDGETPGGYLYYDDTLFQLCRSSMHVWVSPAGAGGTSCIDETDATMSVELISRTVHLRRRNRWCFGSSPAMFVSANDGSLKDSIHSSGDSRTLQCVRTNVHQQIEIEIGMFHTRIVSEQDGTSPTELHSIRVCSSMYFALEKSLRDRYFGMYMGIGSRRREIEYWLAYCGIDIPMAHLWEFSEDDNMNMGSSYPSGSDFISRCDLRKVSGMRYPTEHAWARDESNLFCVHDFLDLLPYHDGSIGDDRDSSHGLQGGASSRPKSLVFISGLSGSPLSVSSLDKFHQKDGEEDSQCSQRESLLDVDGVCTSRRFRPLEVVYEILSVISAFSSVWPHETLVLRSWWSGYSHWASPPAGLFPSLQQLVSASSYDEWSAGIEELWREELACNPPDQSLPFDVPDAESDDKMEWQLLSSLQFSLSLSVAVSSVVVDSSLASAWLQGDMDSRGGSVLGSMISVCNDRLSARSCGAADGSQCLRQPLICSDESLRGELAQLLRHKASASVLRPYMTQPSGSRVVWSTQSSDTGGVGSASVGANASEVQWLSPAGQQLMALSSLIEFSGSACELDRMHSFSNCSYCKYGLDNEPCQSWINKAGKSTKTAIAEVLLDSHGLLHVRNTEAKVYVQIFIEKSEDLGAARAIVQYWREKGPGCHFFTVYSIYVLPDCLEFAEDQYCHLRFVFNSMYEWIVTNTVKADIVVGLIGIESMLAFRFPDASPTGIIPFGAIGSFDYYRLRTPITISAPGYPNCLCKNTRRAFEIKNCALSSWRAFAGLASSIKSMIEGVRQFDYFNSLSGSDGLFGAATRYMLQRYPGLRFGGVDMVDCHSHFFDFDPLTQDAAFELRGLVESLHRENNKPIDLTGQYFYRLMSGSEGPSMLYKDKIEALRVSNMKFDMIAPLLNSEISSITRKIGFNSTVEGMIGLCRIYYHFKDILHIYPAFLHLSLEVTKKFYMWSPPVTVKEKLLIIYMYHNLERMSTLEQNLNSPLHQQRRNNWGCAFDKIVYFSIGAAMFEEIGPLDMEVGTFRRSLIPARYEDIASTRRRQRSRSLNTHLSATHLVTAASEMTDGLEDLLHSAEIAGVTVNVVGLGRPYRGYATKTEWYIEFLSGENTDVVIADDDVVVLIDAYDVMVFPSVRRLAKHMASFPTPIVFCSENGIYPEFAGPWHYFRGQNSESADFDALNQGRQRFLNSGCIAGRASDVRTLLNEIRLGNEYFKDDQQLYVRYLIQNPHLVSVDAQKVLFMTGFKENPADYRLSYRFGVMDIHRTEDFTGIVHCNQKDGNMCHRSFKNMMNIFKTLYLSGPDGTYLLRAIHAIWDQDFNTAAQLLQLPVVKRNSSTSVLSPEPGTNIIGLYLFDHTTAELNKRNAP